MPPPYAPVRPSEIACAVLKRTVESDEPHRPGADAAARDDRPVASDSTMFSVTVESLSVTVLAARIRRR